MLARAGLGGRGGGGWLGRRVLEARPAALLEGRHIDALHRRGSQMPSLLAMMSRVKEDTALASRGSGWAAMTGQTRRGLPCVVQKEAPFTKTRGASCWQGCTAAQLLAEQAGDTSKAASISFGKEIQSSVFRSRPEYRRNARP